MGRGSRRTGGFTLIEMLVVIAIVGVVAGITFPVFVRAKTTARMGACINQLRQIGLAMMMYREDHGLLAPRLSALYPTYLPDARVFVCPADGAQGKHESNDYMEGMGYLPSGVSYTYLPNWKYAIQLGWWSRRPNYGQGKWFDSTPIAMCHWHWASVWKPNLDAPTWGEGTKGWILVLAAGGSVQRVRAELPVEQYSPDGS